MSLEIINGSWIQTITYILDNIDGRLSNTELESILSIISNNIDSNFDILKDDNNLIKISLLNILNEINKLKSDNIIIRNTVTEIKIRVMECCKPKVIVPNPRKTCRPKLSNNNCVPQRPHVVVYNQPTVEFIIDETIRSGHTEGYKIYVSGGYSYHDRLYWFISGNRRRLCHKGELTDEMIDIYKTYNQKIIN